MNNLFHGIGDPQKNPMSTNSTRLDLKYVKNAKTRTLQQILRVYGQDARYSLLKDMLLKLQKDENDNGVACLTSVFLKSQMKDESLDIRASIELVRDFWFKNTLDVLKDKEIYIMDIVETLIESTALFIYLLNLEK